MSIDHRACLLWGVNLEPIKDQLPNDFAEAMEDCGLEIKQDWMSDTWMFLGNMLSTVDEDDGYHCLQQPINTFVMDNEFCNKIKSNTKISHWVKELILSLPRGMYHFVYMC